MIMDKSAEQASSSYESSQWCVEEESRSSSKAKIHNICRGAQVEKSVAPRNTRKSVALIAIPFRVYTLGLFIPQVERYLPQQSSLLW